MCGEFNVRVLKSSLPDLATETLFAEALAHVLFDLHRLAPKLQSCCVNDENRFLRGLLDVGAKRRQFVLSNEKQIPLLVNSFL